MDIQVISFPGLGLENIQLKRIAFNLFGNEKYPIYWYGILFGLAFIVAAVYVVKRVKEFGLDADRMIDVLLGAVIGGLIGARLYYVIFSWDTYKNDLMTIFDVRRGGIAMYGGIIGAVLAILLMSRLRKVKLLPVCDLFASALLISQAIGRWGNFINVEAFGSPTNLPWRMTGQTIQNYLKVINMELDAGQGVHPTFFYESMWCLIGFILITMYVKRRRFDGEITLLYLFWYGLGRSWIEGLRTDSLLLGSMRISQVLAVLCVIGSLIVWMMIRSKIRSSNDPDYMPLYVNTDEGKAILAGTFYNKDVKSGADEQAVETTDAASETENTDEEASEDGEESQPVTEEEAATESEPAEAGQATEEEPPEDDA